MRSNKRLSILLIFIVGMSGCTLTERESPDMLKTTYETKTAHISVYYQDKAVLERVKQALYWHNHSQDKTLSISDEAFLRDVVPLIDSDEESDDGRILIDAHEATAFYRKSFRTQSMKKESQLEQPTGVRFKVESVSMRKKQ